MTNAMTLTEDWLRTAGFKWEQLDRQPTKHWVLSIASACVDPHEADRKMFASPDDLRIEVAINHYSAPAFWYCWLRTDFAGRYSRLIHLRHITETSELVSIIEGVTGRTFVEADCLYGSFHPPEHADRMRKDQERLDKRMKLDWHSRVDAERRVDTSDKAGVDHS